MNTARSIISAATIALAASAAAVAEQRSVMTPAEIRERIQALESSVSESSVTERYTDEQRAAKLDLLQQAEKEVDRGNTAAAIDRVIEAGRMLYPVDADGGNALGVAKRNEWLTRVNKVTGAILPAAHGIAVEKGVDTERLDQISNLHDKGTVALAAGDTDQAEILLVGAYNDLQAAVADMRSGDVLTLELPANDTQEAWKEAERRYFDWRFTADWMQMSAAAMDADPELIATGSRLADQLYEKAAAQAASQQWAKAVETIDSAYTVMEEHWRTAGIDI